MELVVLRHKGTERWAPWAVQPRLSNRPRAGLLHRALVSRAGVELEVSRSRDRRSCSR